MSGMTLSFKRLNDKARIPSRGTMDSAGLDIYAALPDINTPLRSPGNELCVTADEEGKPCVVVPPHTTVLIPTGLAVMPDRRDIAMLIYPRSGLAVNHGIGLANSVAVIDSDYRGEIMIPLHNNSDKDFVVYDNSRIAQLVVTPVLFPDIAVTTVLKDTGRGTGGFGSTGI